MAFRVRIDSFKERRNRLPSFVVALACALTLFAMSLLSVATVAAEDRIRYLDASGQETRERTGTMVDQAGGEFRFDVAGAEGGRLTVPAERVLELEFESSAEWLSAVDAFREGDWETAFEQMVQAYRTETRDWARLEIQAALIRCGLATGRNELACRGFQELLDSDPQTRHAGLVPLAWARGEVDASWRAVAQGWLKAPSEWDRLLGGSWLLNSTSKPDARAALIGLTDSRDSRIRFLAQMQLRRDEVASVDRATLDRWRAEINAAPTELRGGPRWLVATALARLSPGDEAALAYLRCGLEEARHEAWQAEALFGAIRQLASNQPDEAARLRDELLRRFPQSDAARLARQTPLGNMP